MDHLLKRQIQPRGVAPEVLEAVVRALFLVEDVDDDIRVIDDDPVAHRVAVHRRGRDAVLFFQPLLDLARDGLEVRLRGAAANHEEIREVRYAAQIERNHILGLFIRGQFRAARRQFCASQDESTSR